MRLSLTPFQSHCFTKRSWEHQGSNLKPLYMKPGTLPTRAQRCAEPCSRVVHTCTHHVARVGGPAQPSYPRWHSAWVMDVAIWFNPYHPLLSVCWRDDGTASYHRLGPADSAPFFHRYSSVVLFVCILCMAMSWGLSKDPELDRMSSIVWRVSSHIFGALATHLIRDARLGGLCLWPDSTELSIPYLVYIASIAETTENQENDDSKTPRRVTYQDVSKYIAELRCYFMQESNEGSPLSALDTCADFVQKTLCDQRPLFHCISIVLAICVVLMLLSQTSGSPILVQSSWLVTTAVLGHLIRDAAQNGFWICPLEPAPPLPYCVYITMICALPYMIRLERVAKPQKHAFHNEGIQPEEELAKRGFSIYKGPGKV
uniref:Transmembrane protein 267 n=1 Tax=Timema douglasi TaxID=61478 RepID=A0A7R8VS01_TIMDO|nr:unnamed protein product [Timema douglasi]